MAGPTDESNRPAEERATSNFGPELGLALLLMVLALMVITDSIRVGTGWGDDGPRSGYFPFYIGVLLLAASGWTFVSALLKRGRDAGEFATRTQLVSVLEVLLPTVVYVAAMAWLGLYITSAALIAWFMRRHGRYGWPMTAAVSVGVPLVCFGVFERWFLVPLPKGPLEALLGL